MTSADIVRELQGARPVASQALRSRINSLQPAPARARARRPLFAGLTRRRQLLVVLPAAALVAVAAAGITGVLESGSSPQLDAVPSERTVSPGYETVTDADSLAQGSVAKTNLAPVPDVTTGGAATAPPPSSPRPRRFRSRTRSTKSA